MGAAQAFRCVFCGHYSLSSRSYCPRCRAYESFLEESPRAGDGPTRASAIATPRYRRAPLGIPALDLALGGGVVRGSILFLWGAPGTRKTTRAARAADHVAQRLGGVALYLSSEAPPDLVKHLAMTEGHPELTHSWIWHVTDLKEASAEARLRKSSVVVFDSVQMFEQGKEVGTSRSIRAVLREALRLRTAGAVVILVSQINADGEPAGPHVSLHMVDVCVRLTNEGGTITKNRYAPAPVKFTF